MCCLRPSLLTISLCLIAGGLSMGAQPSLHPNWGWWGSMLGSLPGPSGHWGGKSKYKLNILGKSDILPKLISLVLFSAPLLSNLTTCSVNFYDRLAKEVNTLFSVPLPAVSSVLLLHIRVYSHFKILFTAILCFLYLWIYFLFILIIWAINLCMGQGIWYKKNKYSSL